MGDRSKLPRAGGRCGIATAAAVKRMEVLEADAGIVLLARGARGVRATPAGEAFAKQCGIASGAAVTRTVRPHRFETSGEALAFHQAVQS